MNYPEVQKFIWSLKNGYSIVLRVARSAMHPRVYSVLLCLISFSSTLVSLGATITNEMVAHKFCFGGESRLRQLSSHFNITYRQWHFTETDFIYNFISIWCKWSLSFRVYHGTFLSSSPWILELHTLRVSVTLFLSVVLVIVFIWVEQHLMCQNSCTWT